MSGCASSSTAAAEIAARLSVQWQRLLTEHRAPAILWVAVSGGQDSMVLLHWLRYHSGWPGDRLKVLHVDHQLQSASGHWAEHVQSVCREWSLDVVIEKATVKPSGHGLEAAARDARFQQFKKYVGTQDWLVLAHHLGDRAESLLLNLLRGAGPRGLSAMREYDSHQGLSIVRPMLTFTKDDLAEYAVGYGLQWVEDPSNTDNRFDRNFIRLNVIPLLEQRWSHAKHAIAESARWLQEAEAYQESHIAALLKDVLSGDGFDLKQAARFSSYEQKQMIRTWLRSRTGLAPGQPWLDEFFASIASAAPDAQPRLRWHHGYVIRYRDCVYWRANEQSFPVLIERFDWFDVSVPLALPAQKMRIVCISTSADAVAADRAASLQNIGPVSVGPVSGAMRFHPDYRDRATTVKKCFQELAVPPWDRPSSIGLFKNDELIALILPTRVCINSRGSPFEFEVSEIG